MKAVPLTILKATSAMELRDMLREGPILVTQHNKPLAEMYAPGEIEQLKQELDQLARDKF